MQGDIILAVLAPKITRFLASKIAPPLLLYTAAMYLLKAAAEPSGGTCRPALLPLQPCFTPSSTSHHFLMYCI